MYIIHTPHCARTESRVSSLYTLVSGDSFFFKIHHLKNILSFITKEKGYHEMVDGVP